MVYLKCSEVVTKISDIIDDKASLMTRMRFQGHIMMCRDCRRYFKQLGTMKELARKVGEDDFLPESGWPAGFDRVMSALMAEIKREGHKDDG